MCISRCYYYIIIMLYDLFFFFFSAIFSFYSRVLFFFSHLYSTSSFHVKYPFIFLIVMYVTTTYHFIIIICICCFRFSLFFVVFFLRTQLRNIKYGPLHCHTTISRNGPGSQNKTTRFLNHTDNTHPERNVFFFFV